jgi:nucleotide-binding universal stress UspA family protein
MISLKKLLVAFDGSAGAYKAFDFALNLAGLSRERGTEIAVVAVVQPPEPSIIVELDAMIDSATEHFQEHFAKLKEKAQDASVPVTTEVLIGHPADQIIHYASQRRCDIILMGQRGKSRMEQWLLGSVSKRVSSYAPCTVVIVK